MITQAVIPLSILAAVMLLTRPVGCSSSTAAKAKRYKTLYIRENLSMHINGLANKYSCLIGNFGLKLPIEMGRLATFRSII